MNTETNPFVDHFLGETETLVRTQSPSDVLAAVDRMAEQAKYTIRILSPDAEIALYGREAFLDRLRRFISTRSKVAKIRILILDPRPAAQRSHPLINLWHRFPSFIELRELRGDYARNREAFFLVDDIGLIRRQDFDAPDAVITFKNISTASDRARWFDEAFTHGAASVQLRRLSP